MAAQSLRYFLQSTGTVQLIIPPITIRLVCIIQVIRAGFLKGLETLQR